MEVPVLSVGLVVLFFCLILLLYFLNWTSRYHLPPGPRGLPLVGYAPFVGKSLARTSLQLSKKYGSDVIYMKLGMKPVVILNTYQAVHDAFIKNGNTLLDRPGMFFKRFITQGRGIVGKDGEQWEKNRKFTTGLLKEFWWGKSSMEEQIANAVTELLANFEENNGKAIDFQFTFTVAISNVLCGLIMGRKFSFKDEQFLNFLSSIDRTIQKMDFLSILNHLPFLVRVPGDPFRLAEVAETSESVNRFIRNEINLRRNLLITDHTVETFIDAYLVAQKSNQDKNNPVFYDVEMTQITRDLFISGTETVAILLRWLFLFMATYPQIQDRVYREIDDKFGKGKISLSDRAQLPFTDATTMEALRFADMMPLALPRATSADMELSGYVIPKGVMVMANCWAINQDDKLWQNPREFDPANFLNEDQTAVEDREFFIPFMLGKRSCLGEPLARAEIFLFFAYTMQQYQVKFPDDIEPPGLEGVNGIVKQPKPHKLIPVKRQ